MDTDSVYTTSSDYQYSSTGLFGGEFIVFDVHDVTRDPNQPPPGQNPVVPEARAPEARLRKHKKKKKDVHGHKSQSSESESISGASQTASATEVKEEFYDAHDSYYAIPENQPVDATPQSTAPSGKAIPLVTDVLKVPAPEVTAPIVEALSQSPTTIEQTSPSITAEQTPVTEQVPKIEEQTPKVPEQTPRVVEKSPKILEQAPKIGSAPPTVSPSAVTGTSAPQPVAPGKKTSAIAKPVSKPD